MVSRISVTHNNELPSEHDQALTQTPKTQKSSARAQLGLDTIREGTESRKTSAGPSTAVSSNRTYSFHDFKLYAEEYDKPEEKTEADAKNLADIPPTKSIQNSPGGNALQAPVTNRRYSQVTGDSIAKEIVEQVDGNLTGRANSNKHIAMKVQKIKNLVDRRNLSGYVRKRLIDSATKESRAVSAC